MPESFRVIEAEFTAGASSAASFSRRRAPEVAIIGRSNAGKSTLLNRLTGRNKLARVSNTPGRTREVNFFAIKLAAGSRKLELTLTDLPGYGFAKVSKGAQEELGALIGEYLNEREPLRAVLLLMDIRREISAEENEIREMVFSAGKNLILVLTKADKLSKNELAKRRGLLAEQFGLESEDVLLSGEKMATDAIWQRVVPLLDQRG